MCAVIGTGDTYCVCESLWRQSADRGGGRADLWTQTRLTALNRNVVVELTTASYGQKFPTSMISLAKLANLERSMVEAAAKITETSDHRGHLPKAAQRTALAEECDPPSEFVYWEPPSCNIRSWLGQPLSSYIADEFIYRVSGGMGETSTRQTSDQWQHQSLSSDHLLYRFQRCVAQRNNMREADLSTEFSATQRAQQV